MRPEPADDREAVGRERGRVVDRLRATALDRLDTVGPSGRSTAELVHAVAQQLADLAADGAGRVRRPVPELAVHGLADQVAVLVDDVLAEGDAAAVATAARLLAELRAGLV